MNLLGQLCLLFLQSVSATLELVDGLCVGFHVLLLVVPLLLRLLKLGIAPALMLSVAACLLQQPFNHVLDQGLDLCKRIPSDVHRDLCQNLALELGSLLGKQAHQTLPGLVFHPAQASGDHAHLQEIGGSRRLCALRMLLLLDLLQQSSAPLVHLRKSKLHRVAVLRNLFRGFILVFSIGKQQYTLPVAALACSFGLFRNSALHNRNGFRNGAQLRGSHRSTLVPSLRLSLALVCKILQVVLVVVQVGLSQGQLLHRLSYVFVERSQLLLVVTKSYLQGIQQPLLRLLDVLVGVLRLQMLRLVSLDRINKVLVQLFNNLNDMVPVEVAGLNHGHSALRFLCIEANRICDGHRSFELLQESLALDLVARPLQVSKSVIDLALAFTQIRNVSLVDLDGRVPLLILSVQSFSLALDVSLVLRDVRVGCVSVRLQLRQLASQLPDTGGTLGDVSGLLIRLVLAEASELLVQGCLILALLLNLLLQASHHIDDLLHRRQGGRRSCTDEHSEPHGAVQSRSTAGGLSLKGLSEAPT
mmetsp:Transcript_42996/g.103631  ORF Transcript_42996/g.103631 Transcript_42996/m.103631 type:complete len:530 (-) Transcript_42996:2-1591(-)